MTTLIGPVSRGVPSALIDIRTLSKRAEDVLAYSDRFGTSKGPTKP